jgi:hypothetical protein
MQKTNRKLFDRMAGVKLDVGCGPFKQKGCIGIDRVKLPGVDIVHDLQRFPWPIPSNVCAMIVMSHVWEHIEPKYRSRTMDELWRIIRPDGQLFISAPYAGTLLANSHPEHYLCPTELTFTFYDPGYPLYLSGSYGLVKPWKIVRNDPNMGGCIEVILEPYKDAKGRVCLPKELRSGKK